MKYLIAIPALDMIHTATAASLVNMRRVGDCRFSFLCNSLVYDARNMLAAEAIDTGADRILFIDSDMYFQPDMMEHMADVLDYGFHFISGLYFRRKFPMTPLIYDSIEIVTENGIKKGKTVAYTNYPADRLFMVDGCGFGAVMMEISMLKEMFDVYERPFDPMPGVLGEDLAFCYRAQQLGYELWCDPRIKLGHVGQFIYDERYYQPQK